LSRRPLKHFIALNHQFEQTCFMVFTTTHIVASLSKVQA
jgi:hypothetical protein